MFNALDNIVDHSFLEIITLIHDIERLTSDISTYDEEIMLSIVQEDDDFDKEITDSENYRSI